MKAAAFIVLALFVDGVQAAITASVAVIAAFPGTVGGGALGCAAGAALGTWGCAVGGFVLGILGSATDVAAVVTEPIGLIIGFAISICLSATLGAGLITLLIFNNMYYPKWILPSGIAEFVPGFDLIPGWTAMVILCLVQKKKDEMGGVGNILGTVAAPTAAPSALPRSMPVIDGIQPPPITTENRLQAANDNNMRTANDNRVSAAQRYAA